MSQPDAHYPFLASRRLYRTDRRLSFADGTQGSDYYESAIPHADAFLLDLVTAETSEPATPDCVTDETM